MELSETEIRKRVNKHLNEKTTPAEIEAALRNPIVCRHIAEHIEDMRSISEHESGK